MDRMYKTSGFHPKILLMGKPIVFPGSRYMHMHVAADNFLKEKLYRKDELKYVVLCSVFHTNEN